MTTNVRILLEAAASIQDSENLSVAVERLRPRIQESGLGSSTLLEIEQQIATASGLGRRDHLLALLTSLEHLHPTKEGESTVDQGDPEQFAAARRICDFAAKSIAPIVVPPKEEDDVEGYHPTAADVQRDTAAVVSRCQPLAEPGLAVIKCILQNHRRGIRDATDLVGPQVLVTAVAYADPDLPWTTPAASQLAREVIEAIVLAADVSKDAIVVDWLLKDYLRPLFTRSKPDTVTDSGRKAHFAPEPDSTDGVLNRETRAAKPWKHVDLRAVPAFAWALKEADKDLMSRHWPLYTPVLLALLDDGDTSVKCQALRLLDVFLGKVEAKTLIDTGLDSVFQDAVFPALMLLPSVTPEVDCLRILGPAYDALLKLSRVTAAGKQLNAKRPNTKMLDKILREGVFSGFFYAREHIRIVEILLIKTGQVVQEMGIYSVKHLKDLIPMLTSVMEEPFAMAHLPSLLAAIEALQAVIANCWPRLGQPPWRDAIIKALVVCWMRADDDDDDDGSEQDASAKVHDNLAKAAKMLAVVTRSEGIDLAEVVAPLTAQDASLHKLFNISSKG
ncbi:hypothetical protein MCOR25_002697 [Pyricularia grisea]|uniref:Uncharacterized protein n=1 Tax=Pyricularia grisea TaxID=148305 RepID=A0A6P8B287_PYRGI|nr:uncharacterized protein PgNI_07494 [Pyricularia grisea]KAI6376732.1 hypothetical protein MCOR25_002697 [Pyricularia grisea]TLD08966.1 hypothetical protein PgNI_07494 [Pyricularia grisea]